MKNKLCYIERIKKEFYIVDLDKINESLDLENGDFPRTLEDIIESIRFDEYSCESFKLNTDGIERIRTVNEIKTMKEG